MAVPCFLNHLALDGDQSVGLFAKLPAERRAGEAMVFIGDLTLEENDRTGS
ncbi:hypothetical protein O9929_24650 [Vibrio lentus]|nr:hypothetical protein [Vibrio lentus]